MLFAVMPVLLEKVDIILGNVETTYSHRQSPYQVGNLGALHLQPNRDRHITSRFDLPMIALTTRTTTTDESNRP